MKHPPIDLEGLLGTAPGMSAKRPEVFALIVLGLLDSLEEIAAMRSRCLAMLADGRLVA